MKLKNWKHAMALGLALVIVLSTGILNSGNWLHAKEDGATAPAAPTKEPVATEQPAQAQGSTVTEQIVLETKPAETAAAAQTAESTAATDAAQATDTTTATEVTEATQTTEVTEATEPVLPEAELPITVTLVNEKGQSVGSGTWEGKLHFAEGETSASVTLPAVEGYYAPKLTVERKAEDTKLEAKAVYTLAPKTVMVTMKIEGADLGQVSCGGAKVSSGFTKQIPQGETLTFTAKAVQGCTVSVSGAQKKEGSASGEYVVQATADQTVTVTFREMTPEERIYEALDPNRKVTVTFDVPEDGIQFGDTVVLKANVQGYDNVQYTLQWRWSTDNATWNNCPGENGNSMNVVVTEENYQYYWNVLITITGLK